MRAYMKGSLASRSRHTNPKNQEEVLMMFTRHVVENGADSSIPRIPSQTRPFPVECLPCLVSCMSSLLGRRSLLATAKAMLPKSREGRTNEIRCYVGKGQQLPCLQLTN